MNKSWRTIVSGLSPYKIKQKALLDEENGVSAVVGYNDFIDHLFDELTILTCRLLKFTKMRTKAGEAQENRAPEEFSSKEREVLSALHSLIGLEVGVSSDPEIADLDRMLERIHGDIARQTIRYRSGGEPFSTSARSADLRIDAL